MKDFKPEPRPVEDVLPPRAMVMAERTALLPPNASTEDKMTNGSAFTYCRYDLDESLYEVERTASKLDLPMIKLICGPNVNLRNLWHIN